MTDERPLDPEPEEPTEKPAEKPGEQPEEETKDEVPASHEAP